MINFLEYCTDTIKPREYAHSRKGGRGWGDGAGIESVRINEVSYIKKDVKF